MRSLIIFNFRMDKSSRLAFVIDWVNAIARFFERVYVITLFSGDFEVLPNVKVISLKRDRKNRLSVIFYLYKALIHLHKKDKNIIGYFIHMAIRFAWLISPFKYFFRKKMVLWYTHSVVPVELIIADLLTDVSYSTSKNTYPLKYSKKIIPVGHGIKPERFKFRKNPETRVKYLMVVGRISRIKNLHHLLEALGIIKKEIHDFTLTLIGGEVTHEDIEYKAFLNKIIDKYKLHNNVIFKGFIDYNEMPDYYIKQDIIINLTSGSLDKVIIESLVSGVPVLTASKIAYEYFKHLLNNGFYFIDDISKLKDALMDLMKRSYLDYDAKKLREEIEKNHSIDRLSKKIVDSFIK